MRRLCLNHGERESFKSTLRRFNIEARPEHVDIDAVVGVPAQWWGSERRAPAAAAGTDIYDARRQYRRVRGVLRY